LRRSSQWYKYDNSAKPEGIGTTNFEEQSDGGEI
jgi:hypothetical protein